MRLRRTFLLAACTLGLLAAIPMHAQPVAPPATVERPAPVIGDSWTFQRTDGKGDAATKRQPWVVTVVAVSDTEIEYEQEGARHVTDRDWNILHTLDGGRRGPARTLRASLRFPLSAGKTWTHTSSFVNASNQRLRYTPKATVQGWESIMIPAGRFDALRVRSTGYYSGTSASGSGFQGSFEEDYWYSPSAQTIVRYQFSNSSGTSFLVDLTEFRLAPR